MRLREVGQRMLPKGTRRGELARRVRSWVLPSERHHWAAADPAFTAAWRRFGSVNGWLSKREAELLFALAGAVPPGRSIVEIGSYMGRSTCALALGAPEGVQVYAVDPHTGDRSQVERGEQVDTWDAFNANISRVGLTNVIAVRALSADAAAAYEGPPVGLLFVDGWHSAEAVELDVRSWQPHLADDEMVVFDDFEFDEVAKGIQAVTALLPPRAGSIGKDEVYAAHLPDNVLRLLSRWRGLPPVDGAKFRSDLDAVMDPEL